MLNNRRGDEVEPLAPGSSAADLPGSGGKLPLREARGTPMGIGLAG